MALRSASRQWRRRLTRPSADWPGGVAGWKRSREVGFRGMVRVATNRAAEAALRAWALASAISCAGGPWPAGIEGNVRGRSLRVDSAGSFAERRIAATARHAGCVWGIRSVPSSSGCDGALKACPASPASPTLPTPCAVPSTFNDVYLGNTALPSGFFDTLQLQGDLWPQQRHGRRSAPVCRCRSRTGGRRSRLGTCVSV